MGGGGGGHMGERYIFAFPTKQATRVTTIMATFWCSLLFGIQPRA